MKTMGKEEIKHKFRIEYIVPLVHFFLTFLFERVNFIFEDNFAFVNEVARNEAVSDQITNRQTRTQAAQGQAG